MIIFRDTAIYQDLIIREGDPNSASSLRPLDVRTVMIALMVICRGGSFMVEQPGSSAMPLFHRFQWLAKVTRVPLHILYHRRSNFWFQQVFFWKYVWFRNECFCYGFCCMRCTKLLGGCATTEVGHLSDTLE